MNKQQAISLLTQDGWTKADAMKALQKLDFSNDPCKSTVLTHTSSFSGSELYKRQKERAAVKGLLTKKDKETARKDIKYAAKIDEYETDLKEERSYWQKIVESLGFGRKVG
jgi:hypothetical protein